MEPEWPSLQASCVPPSTHLPASKTAAGTDDFDEDSRICATRIAHLDITC
jgi:hypothetical protein